MSFLKSFAEGFQTGWKTGATADYYNRRSGKDADPFGDSARRRVDPDFAEAFPESGPFGKISEFFGEEKKPGPTGLDRAISDVRIAEKTGDAEKIGRAALNVKKLRSLTPEYALGGMVEERGNETQPDPELERILAESEAAVVTGAKEIQSDLTGGGALPEGESPQAFDSFVRAEGRAADEEVTAVDRAIDPDNTLPQEYRAPARLALVDRFYRQQGNPEAAATSIKQLMLYDKFATQALGTLSLNALRRGDLEAGVRFLRDAYNNNDYDGRVMVASVSNRANDAGGPVVNVEVKKDGQTVEKVQATPQQVAQMAQRTATGQAYMDRVLAIAGRYEEMRAGQRSAGRSPGAGRAPQTIEGAGEFTEGLLNRVTGRVPAAPAQQEATALPENAPLPPRRGEDTSTPEQRIDASAAEAQTAFPAVEEPIIQPGRPSNLPPVPDDTAPRTWRPFDVVDRAGVADDFAEALPVPPQRPAPPQLMPRFSLDVLTEEERAAYEGMDTRQRQAVERSYNNVAAARNKAAVDAFKAAETEYKDAVKTFNADTKRATDGMKPRTLDANAAEEVAAGVEDAFKQRLNKVDAQGNTTDDVYGKIPAGQRDTFRELGVSIVAANPNMTASSAAANVLALTRIDTNDPFNAGFRVVRDRRNNMTYAEFPDGRVIRMPREALVRLAAVRSERKAQFDAEAKTAAAKTATDTARGDRKSALFPQVREEIGRGIRNLMGDEAPKSTTPMTSAERSQASRAAASKRERDREIVREAEAMRREEDRMVANSIQQLPEYRDAVQALEQARLRNDRVRYRQALDRLKAITDGAYGAIGR